jgi:hypothetical protein
LDALLDRLQGGEQSSASIETAESKAKQKKRIRTTR